MNDNINNSGTKKEICQKSMKIKDDTYQMQNDHNNSTIGFEEVVILSLQFVCVGVCRCVYVCVCVWCVCVCMIVSLSVSLSVCKHNTGQTACASDFDGVFSIIHGVICEWSDKV